MPVEVIRPLLTMRWSWSALTSNRMAMPRLVVVIDAPWSALMLPDLDPAEATMPRFPKNTPSRKELALSNLPMVKASLVAATHCDWNGIHVRAHV